MLLHRAIRVALVLLTAAVLWGTQVRPASATPYDDAVMALSPLGYWTFEDASSANGAVAADSSVHARHGLYTGTSLELTADTPGPGSAKALNLSDAPTNVANYIGGISTTGLPDGSSSRTVVGWMKVNPSGTFQWVFEYGTREFGQDYLIGLHGAPPTDRLGITQYGLSLTDSGVFPGDDEWHMFAITTTQVNTFTASYAVYMDGNLVAPLHDSFNNVASSLEMTTITTLGPQLTLGTADIDSTSYGFRGYLDNVAIFEGALTGEQIKGLYDAMAIPVPEPSSAALLLVGSAWGMLGFRRKRVALRGRISNVMQERNER